VLFVCVQLWSLARVSIEDNVDYVGFTLSVFSLVHMDQAKLVLDSTLGALLTDVDGKKRWPNERLAFFTGDPIASH